VSGSVTNRRPAEGSNGVPSSKLHRIPPPRDVRMVATVPAYRHAESWRNVRSEVNDAKPPPEHRQPPPEHRPAPARTPSSPRRNTAKPPSERRFDLPTLCLYLSYGARNPFVSLISPPLRLRRSVPVSGPSRGAFTICAWVVAHRRLPSESGDSGHCRCRRVCLERPFQVALRRGVMSSASQVMNRRTRFGTVRP
jgi:hypothetical protein